jgi:hypothetical protein
MAIPLFRESETGDVIRISQTPRTGKSVSELRALLRTQLDSQLSYLAVPQAIANIGHFDEWLAKNVFTPPVVEIIGAGHLSEGTISRAWWTGQIENVGNAAYVGLSAIDVVNATSAILFKTDLLETQLIRQSFKIPAWALRKLAERVAKSAYTRLAEWLARASTKVALKLSASAASSWVPVLGWVVAVGGWIWTAHDLISLRGEFIDAIVEALWPTNAEDRSR